MTLRSLIRSIRFYEERITACAPAANFLCVEFPVKASQSATRAMDLLGDQQDIVEHTYLPSLGKLSGERNDKPSTVPQALTVKRVGAVKSEKRIGTGCFPFTRRPPSTFTNPVVTPAVDMARHADLTLSAGRVSEHHVEAALDAARHGKAAANASP